MPVWPARSPCDELGLQEQQLQRGLQRQPNTHRNTCRRALCAENAFGVYAKLTSVACTQPRLTPQVPTYLHSHSKRVQADAPSSSPSQAPSATPSAAPSLAPSSGPNPRSYPQRLRPWLLRHGPQTPRVALHESNYYRVAHGSHRARLWRLTHATTRVGVGGAAQSRAGLRIPWVQLL